MKIRNSIKILLLGEILGFIIVFLLLIFKGMGADGEGGAAASGRPDEDEVEKEM